MIGPWKVMPTLHRLTCGETTVQLEPRLMRLLTCLADHAGEVMTKAALTDTVWPDVVVDDLALARAISELRKVLNDTPATPTYIETIRTRGYRLIAPVQVLSELDVQPPPPQKQSPPRTAPRWTWGVAGVLVAFAMLSLGIMGWVATHAPPLVAVAPPLPLTSDDGWEVTPALSPDGAFVAYAARDRDAPNWHLFVQPVDSDERRALTADTLDDVAPTFSPDGTQLAFQRFLGPGVCDIYVVRTLGGPLRRLTSCGYTLSLGLTWSPDGDWLVYGSQEAPDAMHGLVRYHLETGTIEPLTHPDIRYGGDALPMFSPDGRWVAFVRNVSEFGQEVFVVPATGGTARRLTHDAHTVAGLDWMPDSKTILFSSNRNGNFRLWQVGLEGQEPVGVPFGENDAMQPRIARHGGRLVYQYMPRDLDYWRVAFDAAGQPLPPQPVLTSTQIEKHAQFAPDGKHIAFVSSQSGSYEVWVADLESGAKHQLTHVGGASVRTPRWSPDGTHLAFSALEGEHERIFLIPATGGTPQPLTSGTGDDRLPHWSRDGQWVYFSSNRGEQWDIWKQPVAGGAPRQVTTAGGLNAQESLDGKTLYYVKVGEPGLWRRSWQTGEEQQIIERFAWENGGNWNVTEGGICYVYRPPQVGAPVFEIPSPISCYDPDDGTLKTMMETPALVPWQVGSMTIAEDQHAVLFAQVTQLQHDLRYMELEARASLGGF